jgi:hypothetical protein
VTYDRRVRQAEVGTECVQEPAAVADTVARGGLVRLAETRKIQGVDGKALRETLREVFPNLLRREPAVYEQHRRPPACDAVADKVPFEFHILGFLNALNLVRRPREHERRRDQHYDQQQDYDQNATHGRDDNPTRAPRA